MKERAEKNYHPAVRYNAMLTIGELNMIDNFGTAPSPPWEKAMPALLAAANDPQQIVPVKVAALVGISRHIAAGPVKPEMQSQLLPLMLKFAAGDDVPKDPDQGREWLQMQAVEILGLLHSVGANNQVVDLLVRIIGDEKTLPMTRCAAVCALKELNYPPAGGLKSADLVKALGEYLLYCCTKELKTIGSTPAKDIFLRRMLTRINAVQDALNGVKILAKSQPEQKYLEELKGIADELAKNLVKPGITIEIAKKNLEDTETKLKEWVEKKP